MPPPSAPFYSRRQPRLPVPSNRTLEQGSFPMAPHTLALDRAEGDVSVGHWRQIPKEASRLAGSWGSVASMPRIARVVIPGMLHHVTQRGSRRAGVFFSGPSVGICPRNLNQLVFTGTSWTSRAETIP